jgi:hypothetical protein
MNGILDIPCKRCNAAYDTRHRRSGKQARENLNFFKRVQKTASIVPLFPTS